MATQQPVSQSVVLVTGPSRSGKSEWAETLAMRSGKTVIYVATAQTNPDDLEWQLRIEQHQRRRPEAWQTMNVPVDLVTILQMARETDCLLIDSLGTWLANVLEQDEDIWQQTVQALLFSLVETRGQVIMVAEETGWGVVPAYPLGRTFRDRLGTLTRHIGAIANPVYLVAGGHILNLSQIGTPLQQAINATRDEQEMNIEN